MAITDFLQKPDEEQKPDDQQGAEKQQTPQATPQADDKTDSNEQSNEQSESQGSEEGQGEQPSQEQPSQEQSSESASEGQESQQQEEQQATPQDYAELIKEQLSERGVDASFESIDELAEKLKSANESPFATEAVKEINEFIKKGEGDIGDYIKYKQTDFENMDGLELVRMQTKDKYPNLSKEQIDNFLSDHYSLDEDEYSEREVSVGKTRLAMDAEKARKEYLDRKQTLQAKIDEPYQPPKQKEQQGPSEEDMQKFNQKVEQTFKDALAFNEGDFKYHVKDEVAQKIPKNLGEMFLKEDGKSFDFTKFNKARVFANDPEKFVQAAIEHGKSLERESIKKDRYNQDLEGSSKPPEKDKGTLRDSLSVFRQAKGNKMGFGG